MEGAFQEDIEFNLTAHYELEEFVYDPSLRVKVRSATSTRGSNLTCQDRDRTGIMIWPATHLLCQEIVSGHVASEDQAILELGCGCGLVGVVAALVSAKEKQKRIWVSSDKDVKALELCGLNYEMNGIDTTPVCGPTIRQLTWGDMDQMMTIQGELLIQTRKKRFDAVVAADIVYPSTAGQALTDLFATVDFFLREGGVFYLAFASRDGYQTPLRLIQAASIAGFAISSREPLQQEIRVKLPPLLDSILLLLERSEHAREVNETLGRLNCSVFPRMRQLVLQAADESSEEEWDAPGVLDGE